MLTDHVGPPLLKHPFVQKKPKRGLHVNFLSLVGVIFVMTNYFNPLYHGSRSHPLLKIKKEDFTLSS